jgi:hypothetical protein
MRGRAHSGVPSKTPGMLSCSRDQWGYEAKRVRLPPAVLNAVRAAVRNKHARERIPRRSSPSGTRAPSSIARDASTFKGPPSRLRHPSPAQFSARCPPDREHERASSGSDPPSRTQYQDEGKSEQELPSHSLQPPPLMRRRTAVPRVGGRTTIASKLSPRKRSKRSERMQHAGEGIWPGQVKCGSER